MEPYNTVILARKKQNEEVVTTKSEELRIQEVIVIGCINRVDHRKTRQIALQPA